MHRLVRPSVQVLAAALAGALLIAPARAPADAKTRLDLPALVDRAREQPKVVAARARAEGGHARATAVGRAWGPQLEVTAVGGPSPNIRCMPSPADCETTEPGEVGLQFSGVFWRLDARLAMPLFTFGKLAAGHDAARAGARAGDALASQAEADAVLEAARAYYAVKLGRELVFMLEEGRGYVEDELEREDKLLAQGSPEVTESDRLRLRALRAEIDARLSEARRVEALGLAGIHAIVGDASIDIDEEPLAAVIFELPEAHDARAQAQAGRPERVAAEAAADASHGLARLEANRWWPDLVLVGTGTLAQAQGADDPLNAYFNDPYNTSSGALGVALRWSLDPLAHPARVAQADAEARGARATAAYAKSAVAADAERAWAEARDARDRLAAARTGVRAAKAWLVSVLQAEAANLVEPKELADALLSYFTMRGRVIQATYDWNVAVVGLVRAVGGRFSPPRYQEVD